MSQLSRPTGGEHNGPGHDEREAYHSRRDQTDHARRDQSPAGLPRQLLDAVHQLLIDGACRSVLFFCQPSNLGCRDRQRKQWTGSSNEVVALVVPRGGGP
jgi:hypothetical protein